MTKPGGNHAAEVEMGSPAPPPASGPLEVSNNSSEQSSSGGLLSCLGRSFSMGSLFGIPIDVHYSFLLLVVITVAFSITSMSVKYSLLEFLIMGPILFITILIHELGHSLTARALGGTTVGIIIWPLGGLAVSTPPEPATNCAMMSIAFGGPATHFFQMAFWLVLAILLVGGASFESVSDANVTEFIGIVAWGAFWLNVILLLFNLFLPAYPLDGGQILASFLLMVGFTPDKAGSITAKVAMAISVLIGLWGLYSLVMLSNPFSILTIVIAVFIFRQSQALNELANAGLVRHHPLFNTVPSQSN